MSPNDNLLRTLDTWQIFGIRGPYTWLSQCYFHGVYATYFDANYVVMLRFKFVCAVFYDIFCYCFSLMDTICL